MSKLTQNHVEHLSDRLQRGILTADEANIEKVRIARVQVVTGRLPSQVRKALNGAVKRGYLAHWKREGNKPEVYFHPTFDYLAREARDKHERKVLSALAGVSISMKDQNEPPWMCKFTCKEMHQEVESIRAKKQEQKR